MKTYLCFVRDRVDKKIKGFSIFTAERDPNDKWRFKQIKQVVGWNDEWPHIEANQGTIIEDPYMIVKLIFSQLHPWGKK
jgi:hypothetical protein